METLVLLGGDERGISDEIKSPRSPGSRESVCQIRFCEEWAKGQTIWAKSSFYTFYMQKLLSE